MAQRLEELLKGYTQQRIPTLASRTSIPSSRLEVKVNRRDALQDDAPSLQFVDQVDQDFLWNAIIRLIGAYADSSDMLVVELMQSEGMSDWKDRISTFRIKIDQDTTRKDACKSIARIRRESKVECSFGNLVKASKEGGMNLTEGQSPALITIGTSSLAQTWYLVQGIAVLIDSEQQSLTIIGDASIISREMADVLGRQIWQLYASMKSEPSLPFKKLQLRSNDLLSQYEPPYDPNEAHLPIEWLYRNAKNRPEAIAHELCDEPDDEQIRYLTFGQLNERSNRMANWLLHNHNVQHGQPIGVMRKRDEHFYIAMAAILKAGCCYLPIDKDLPKERKEFIIRDSDAALLLTDKEGAESNLANKPSFNMDDISIQKEISQFHPTAPNVKVDLDDLAYILYTSGTSGNPKGCLLMHRGLYWAIKMFVEIPSKITNPDTDKRLAMAAVAFDVHVSEMVQGWAIGTRLVSISSRMSLLADLQGAIERFGITHIGMVPSMIEATLTKSPSELPLKYITSGGEKINDNVLQKWASHPDILFGNLYGPTEATIGCTARIIRGTNEPKEDIGHAFVGSGAYIADSDLNILPKGVSGELIIEGPLVARGYLNLPEATKKNFIEWPRKGCRSYRTGDLVRMNYDGSLSIHGRIDSQIKLRGVRIESEGVSAVISNASKQVRIDAVSVICKHEAVGNADMLITFITHSTQKDKSKSANERRGKPEVRELEDMQLMNTLRKASIEGLASYMRPSHIIPLTFFPLSHNGKIDTKPLASLFAETSMSTLMKVQGLMSDEEGKKEKDTFVAPSNEEEKVVVRSIAELIGLDPSKLSMRQKLLEIGLSSLNCANLTAILRSKTGLKLNVSDVLTCETIADCSTLVSNHKSDNDQPSWDLKQFQKDHMDAVHQHIASENIEGIYPALPVQPGVLFHAMQENTGYVQHFTYRIDDENISIDAIHSAWKDVQSHLDILRTVFVLNQGEVIQVVLRNNACSVPFIRKEIANDALSNEKDFQAFLENEKVLESAASQINQDFGSPMFSVTILEAKDSSSTTLMTVSFSHTIYDAFAVRNVMTTFDNVLSKKSTLDNHLPMSTLIDQLNSTPEQQHRIYWQSALEGAIEERKKLSWQPLQSIKVSTSRRTNKVLDVGLDDVQKRCNEIGVTLQTFFNVIFALSARSIFPTWQNYALFGNVRSGRNLPLININKAAYPLVTVVPCVIDLSSKQIDKIFKTTHSSWTKSVEHENVALSQIQIWAKSRNLVEILFSCRIETSKDRSNAYQSIKHFSTSEMDPEFPLAVEVLFDQTADSIDVRVAHAPSIITTDQIGDLLRQIQANVRALLDGETLEITSDNSLKLTSRPSQNKESAIDVDWKVVNDLQEALSAFLKVERNVLQPNTSLVSLGMTSLRAVAFSHSIAKSLDLQVDPIDVVQGDSVISIAQEIKKKNKVNEKEEQEEDTPWTLSKEESIELGDIKVDKDDIIEIAPCTPLQTGMLAQTIASEGKLYIHAFVMRLNKKDQSSIDRIFKIWSDIYASYGILRTSFHFLSSNGQWIQAEHSTKSCPLRIIEIAEKVDESQARTLSTAHLNIKGEEDLRKPPIELILFRQSELLVLALHHALYDGVSLANLFEYATNLYNGIPLPQTPSFLPIARQIVGSEEKATAYWVERLKSVKQNIFLKPRKGDDKSTQAWRDGTKLNKEEKEIIQSFKRRYGVSSQSIGQVAFAYTLFEFSQKQNTDIVFCQVVSGRTKIEVGQVIGPVFNTVAIRINLTGDKKAREIVQQVQYENGQSLSWQHAPLRSVQRRLQKTNLSDALFLYQPGVESKSNNHTIEKPWTLQTSTSEEGSTQFTLNLELHDSLDKEDELSVRASCAANILSQAELKEIVQLFRMKLLEIVQSPNKILALGTETSNVNGTNNFKGKINGTTSQSHGGQPIEDSTLANILSQVLHVKTELIKSHTNLSSIGLDSIAAMQIASRARKQGYGITPMQVLRCTTVKELLDVSGAKSSKVNQKHKVRIEKGAIRTAHHIVQIAKDRLHSSIAEYAEGYIPTAGMRYLFSGWQRSGARQFQICIGRRTESGERLNLIALKKSWTALTLRHTILRSTIVPSGNVEVPLVLFVVGKDHWNGLQEIVDKRKECQTFTLEEQEAFAKEFGRSLLRSPTSNRTPSSRLVILQLPEFDCFFVQMPHTHYDAFTVPHLLDELSQEYTAHNKDENYESTTSKDDLEEFESYLTYSILGDESDQFKQDNKRKEYFQKTLGNQQEVHLWQDIKTAKDISHKPITYFVRELRQGTPKVHELQQYSERMQLTPAAILTSTWAHVHSNQMGKSSSTFAFVNSGRSAEMTGIENFFAPTINLVPTFLNDLQDLSKDSNTLRSSIINAAKRIQEHWKQQPSWSIQSNMSDIKKWVNCPADESSIFNTTLNVQIRPSKQAGSLRDTVKSHSSIEHSEKPNWLPIRLQAPPHPPFNDRGWSQEDLNAFKVPDLLLDENDNVSDPSVRIDARMVVAASQATENEESVIILEAEVAREVLSRETVDSALNNWAQLLKLVVEA